MRDGIIRMQDEIQSFQDVEKLRQDFEMTKSLLLEQKQGYLKRRDSSRQQNQSVNAEYELLKKSLNLNEIGKELEDTEKRLRHYERTIFDLKEFVDSKSRETDFQSTKLQCLALVNSLNDGLVKKLQEYPSHK